MSATTESLSKPMPQALKSFFKSLCGLIMAGAWRIMGFCICCPLKCSATTLFGSTKAISLSPRSTYWSRANRALSSMLAGWMTISTLMSASILSVVIGTSRTS